MKSAPLDPWPIGLGVGVCVDIGVCVGNGVGVGVEVGDMLGVGVWVGKGVCVGCDEGDKEGEARGLQLIAAILPASLNALALVVLQAAAIETLEVCQLYLYDELYPGSR